VATTQHLHGASAVPTKLIQQQPRRGGHIDQPQALNGQVELLKGRGSAIGAVYRHLTPEMQAHVLATIDECLGMALKALAAPMRPQQDNAGSAGNEGMAVQ
jgi:hypothetical protein